VWPCAISLGLDFSVQTIDLINRQAIPMPWMASNGTIIMMSCTSSAGPKQFAIMSSLRDGVILWTLSDDGIEARRLPDSVEDVGMVNFIELADRRTIAVFGYRDATIRTQDVATGNKFGPAITGFAQEGRRSWTMACTALSDQRVVVVTANEDAPVRVWD